MSQKNKEKALKYYPDPWTKAMLKKMVEAGKLTAEEYKEVTGEDYEAE